MPKLTIEFGGLCLFVQRTSPGNKGLCVLMPRDRMHGHSPKIREKRSGSTFAPISGSWDLTDLEGGTDSPAKQIRGVDPVQCTVGTGCAEGDLDCGDD